MACLNKANSNNFLVWNKVSGALTLSQLQSGGLPIACDNTNPIETYDHKYLTDHQYTIYANNDTLDTNVSFNDWRVDLVHADSFVQVVNDVMTLTKDIISGTDYRWYSTFTFPVVDNNCYRFVIIDTADSDAVLYISNEIESVDSSEGLILCKFRNGVNIQNYNYEGLPSFYNIFHVELDKRKPLSQKNTGGYDKADGSFFRVRTVRTKTYEFVTGWFDENEHDATDIMLIHSSLQLGIDGNYTVYNSGEDGGYEPPWQDNYQLIQVAFRLEQENESSSNRAL
jgi:hypothetical protein